MNLHIKTEETIKLEHEIWKTINKQGVFGVLECTIGWYGKERVDMMSYDTKGIWRCFEIKISKSDFHSKAHNTFIGNYNYYVMPKALYDDVKDEIPNHVGVWVDGNWCIKKAKKQELQVDEQILKDSMIRSLCRDVNKQMQSDDEYLINKYKRELNRTKSNLKNVNDKYKKLSQWVREQHTREEIRNIF